jgi:hypothetical protein
MVIGYTFRVGYIYRADCKYLTFFFYFKAFGPKKIDKKKNI